MKQATLHQLQVFEAIAKHGSFTKAAEELFLLHETYGFSTNETTLAILSNHSLTLEWENGLLVMLDVEGFPIQKHW